MIITQLPYNTVAVTRPLDVTVINELATVTTVNVTLCEISFRGFKLTLSFMFKKGETT